jgi:hypothetical protein
MQALRPASETDEAADPAWDKGDALEAVPEEEEGGTQPAAGTQNPQALDGTETQVEQLLMQPTQLESTQGMAVHNHQLCVHNLWPALRIITLKLLTCTHLLVKVQLEHCLFMACHRWSSGSSWCHVGASTHDHCDYEDQPGVHSVSMQACSTLLHSAGG